MPYDNKVVHQNTVYENGHRITEDEARAYASLLGEEIENLKENLRGTRD